MLAVLLPVLHRPIEIRISGDSGNRMYYVSRTIRLPGERGTGLFFRDYEKGGAASQMQRDCGDNRLGRGGASGLSGLLGLPGLLLQSDRAALDPFPQNTHPSFLSSSFVRIFKCMSASPHHLSGRRRIILSTFHGATQPRPLPLHSQPSQWTYRQVEWQPSAGSRLNCLTTRGDRQMYRQLNGAKASSKRIIGVSPRCWFVRSAWRALRLRIVSSNESCVCLGRLHNRWLYSQSSPPTNTRTRVEVLEADNDEIDCEDLSLVPLDIGN